MVKHFYQNRDEGVYGDEYERDLADVRGLVKASKLTYRQIAILARLNLQTVSNIASGATARPHDHTIRTLLVALGCSRVIVYESVQNVEGQVKVVPHWPKSLQALRAVKCNKHKKRLRTKKAE